MPILLRELSGFDWRFPREQERLTDQLGWLARLSQPERAQVFAPFAALALPSLRSVDWVNDPASYMEQLTSALWGTHQMPAFRSAAEAYARQMEAARPPAAQLQPRWAIVVLDGSLGRREQRGTLYKSLRRHGVLLTQVDPTDGWATLLAHCEKRSKAAPESYAHWYIDGAVRLEGVSNGLAAVSYDALEPTRQRLLERARDVMSAQRSGPEELRTLMARLTPEQVGLERDHDPTLAHFQLSLLTEGSGTQVFSTTFVQWAARECLRRAEPQTLLARFTARQRQQGMNELLGGAKSIGPDPEGSLVDADQGAYYTWLNLQRLSHAAQSRFLVWQEGQPAAVAIGPGLPQGTTSTSPLTMGKVLALLS